MDTIEYAKNYMEELTDSLKNFDYGTMNEIVIQILKTQARGNQIFIFGNGGSAATSSHFACDLGYVARRGKVDHSQFRVRCLNDNIPTIMAIANDENYSKIFSSQLISSIYSGDLVIAVSGSGNSANIIEAVEYLQDEHDIHIIGVTGFDGGMLKDYTDTCFIAAAYDMQKVEDIHAILFHMIMRSIQQLV